MPLIKKTLDIALEEAFRQAMLEFIRVTKNSGGKDVSDLAIAAASDKFAGLASTAIDTYVRTATIIVPGAGTAVIS
jgi:hypothetical protein